MDALARRIIRDEEVRQAAGGGVRATREEQAWEIRSRISNSLCGAARASYRQGAVDSSSEPATYLLNRLESPEFRMIFFFDGIFCLFFWWNRESLSHSSMKFRVQKQELNSATALESLRNNRDRLNTLPVPFPK